MALRYKFTGELGRPVSDAGLVRPQAMRAPEIVEFRPGADMKALVKNLTELQTVVLDAAVGAGKSTKFPSVLAAETKALVIHVVPNKLLALDLFGYVAKQIDAGDGLAVPVERWSSVDQTVPRTGVLFMSSADLIQLVATRGLLDRYPGVTVFLDEAHESDACTYLIRNLGLNLGMSRLVLSSATFSPSGFRPRETVGQLVEDHYDSDLVPRDWQIDDSTKPWYYGLIQNNLLIFVDSRGDARVLKQAYEDVGMLVYRLEANMPEDEFRVAMKALRDKKGPLVVLLADYSFRSGFTFDVDRVIDSGSVSYYDPTPGAVRKLSRPMCKFESVQAAGRCGRIRKGKVRYFSPRAEYPAQICDIEGVEREAAAYLSRILGFKPTGPLSSTIMSREDLPDGLSVPHALNSQYPLTYNITDSKGRPRSPSPVKQEVVDDTKLRVERRDSAMDKSEIVMPANDLPPPKYVDDVDYKAFIASLDAHPDIPPVGEYMKVSGVGVRESPTVTFPSGLRSVRSLLAGRDGSHNVRGLTDADRKFAISLVVNRYNMLNVEIEAMDTSLKTVARVTSNIPVAVKQVALEVFEERGRLVAERGELHACLDVLTHRMYDIRVLKPFDDLVQERVVSYDKRFAHSDGDSDRESEYARGLASLSVADNRAHNAIDYEHHKRRHRRIRYHLSDGSKFSVPADDHSSVVKTRYEDRTVWRIKY